MGQAVPTRGPDERGAALLCSHCGNGVADGAALAAQHGRRCHTEPEVGPVTYCALSSWTDDPVCRNRLSRGLVAR